MFSIVTLWIVFNFVAFSTSLPILNSRQTPVVKKRSLLWDYTSTQQVPWAMNNVNFNGPVSSVSNWNTWVPPELQGRVAFRPMIRTLAQLSGSDWTNIQNSDQPIIHFFNEPERQGINPQQAADIWNNQLVPFAKANNKKLVSPSSNNGPDGVAWIEAFLPLVASNPPDYLGIHYYGTDPNDAQHNTIEKLHALLPDKPVIVSEIACLSHDYPTVLQFTAQLANWMDTTDWVFEYGFFGMMPHVADGFVSPEAQLMRPDGSFTDLGQKLMWDQPIQG